MYFQFPRKISRKQKPHECIRQCTRFGVSCKQVFKLQYFYHIILGTYIIYKLHKVTVTLKNNCNLKAHSRANASTFLFVDVLCETRNPCTAIIYSGTYLSTMQVPTYKRTSYTHVVLESKKMQQYYRNRKKLMKNTGKKLNMLKSINLGKQS